MGKVFSCDRCQLTASTSVFTFSEDLVAKIIDGVDPPPLVEEAGLVKDLNDRQWMEKIHCIDNVHTNLYGLSLDGFNKAMARLERRLNAFDTSSFSDASRVKECYLENPDCTLRCASIVDEYTDRIDLARLQRIKMRVDEDEAAEKAAAAAKSR